MAGKKAKRWVGRIYLGTDEAGHQLWDWVGRFDTKRERDDAVATRRLERKDEIAQAKRPPGERITCGEYADDYIERMESEKLRKKNGDRFKASSIDTARGQLRRFKADFASRPLSSIERYEAIRWAERHERKQGVMQSVVTLFNLAVDEELIDRNPFRGLMRKPEGRAGEAPPTDEELGRLGDACSALGDYAPRMRAMLGFAAHSGLRPGELYALTWEDIDLEAGEVNVRQRVYRGTVDTPKSNKPRKIALTAPAMEAVLTLPERQGYVFRSKTGKRMSAPTQTAYWSQVLARAGLDHDFYLATKHYCVHTMKVRYGISNADIATQMGWSESAVEKMVATYGHAEIGAAERIRAAYGDNVVPLRSATEHAA